MDITEKERELLKQLRSSAADVIKPEHGDENLICWLRARKHDVKEAEAMYRKSMRWRADLGVDSILDTYERPHVMATYYPGGLCGYDKEGCPVNIFPIGRLDMKGVLYSLPRPDILRSVVYDVEVSVAALRRQTARLGRPVTQAVQILDIDGFGRSHFWKPGADLFIEILSVVENNYPEMLKKTYILNAPSLFRLCWGFISQFIDENTRKKFVFLGNNWKEELAKDLDMSTLPVHWGGQLRGPDDNPYCSPMVRMGGKVPEKYYLTKDNMFPKGIQLEKTQLASGEAKAFKVSVTDVGQNQKALRYFFCTDSGSIIFGVYRKPAGREEATLPLSQCEVLEPVAEYACSRVPADGLCVCDRPGTYILVFNNRSGIGSFFFSRQITHCVEVISYDGATRTIRASREDAVMEGDGGGTVLDLAEDAAAAVSTAL